MASMRDRHILPMKAKPYFTKEIFKVKKHEISQDDVSKLRQLATIDDREFSRILVSVMSALGASSRQTAAISANSAQIGQIKNMLASASDADIKRLASHLGQQKTGELINAAEATACKESTEGEAEK